MNENINLCEILKEHEGETFYSPIYGNINLTKIYDDFVETNRCAFDKLGKFSHNGECMLFPSKDQQDWNKWVEEQKNKVPKTWEECYKILGKGEYIDTYCCISKNIRLTFPEKTNKNMLPIGLGKPMIALMQLLVCREVYRQGWKPDWSKSDNKYVIMNYRGIISTENYSFMNYVLSFQSMEIRDKFLENFRDLIEEAKELI